MLLPEWKEAWTIKPKWNFGSSYFLVRITINLYIFILEFEAHWKNTIFTYCYTKVVKRLHSRYHSRFSWQVGHEIVN